MKCKVCNKRFKLLSSNKYLVEINGGSILRPLKEIYEAFDCPKCGCQNLLNVRENNTVEMYEEKPDGYLANECELAGYNKAIDDFVKRIDEQMPIDICDGAEALYYVEEIAEQLKKGANNE